jgi:hypothetical protein
LHPLALEDIFHERKQNRSKADYYSKHLFLRILCHELRDVDEPDNHSPTLTGIPLSGSPKPMSEHMLDNMTDDNSDYGNHHRPPRKNHRFLPRLGDIEAMLDPQDSHSSFALETEKSHTKVEHEVSLEALKKVGFLEPPFVLRMQIRNRERGYISRFLQCLYSYLGMVCMVILQCGH